jgi:hypothetical protein
MTSPGLKRKLNNCPETTADMEGLPVKRQVGVPPLGGEDG